MGYLDLPDYRPTDSLRKPLAGRSVTVGICGSIGAPKAQQLVTGLKRLGATVRIVMTREAVRFIGRWALEPLADGGIYGDLFERLDDLRGEPHVEIARMTDLMVIYPATGDLIAAIRYGFSSSPVALVANQLGELSKLLLFPAMSSELWTHADRDAQIGELRNRGAAVVEPSTGRLASGASGVGRLVEPELALQLVRARIGRLHGDLRGRRIIVSAGGNREPIDPVRYLTNRSSGRQGFAIAEAARDRGAEVILLTAATATPPVGMEVVRSTPRHRDLDAALREFAPDADAYIGAAAVADFTTPDPVPTVKRKREPGASFSVTLEPTSDIIGSVSAPGLLKVAFAAETADVESNAARKLESKGAELVVMNDVTMPGAGFEHETNRVTIFNRGGGSKQVPADPTQVASKYDVGWEILDEIAPLLAARPPRAPR